jgi:hypothetical protein
MLWALAYQQPINIRLRGGGGEWVVPHPRWVLDADVKNVLIKVNCMWSRGGCSIGCSVFFEDQTTRTQHKGSSQVPTFGLRKNGKGEPDQVYARFSSQNRHVEIDLLHSLLFRNRKSHNIRASCARVCYRYPTATVSVLVTGY